MNNVITIPRDYFPTKWKWIAIDKDGEVTMFECKPIAGDKGDWWVAANVMDDCESLGIVNPPDNWKDTLRKL